MNKLYFIFILSMVVGCKKISPPDNEIIDRQSWSDVMAVTDVEFVSMQGNELYFDIRAVAMKNGSTYIDYPDSAFKSIVFTNGITVSPVLVSTSQRSNQLSFQTVLLIDETASDFNSNPNIVDAINRLNKLSRVGNQQHFGIGFFARDQVQGNGPVHFLKNEASGSIFEHSEQDIMGFAVENYLNLGKSTNSSFYDAIDAAADQLINNPLSANRSITVVFNSLDDGLSHATHNNLVQKCLANNIKINLITYKNPTYQNFRLALETKGFIIDYKTYYYISRVGSGVYLIYDLLTQNYKEYIIRCVATRASNWSTGATLNAYIEITHQQEIYSQYFQEDLHNDLDIDYRLPIYIRVP